MPCLFLILYAVILSLLELGSQFAVAIPSYNLPRSPPTPLYVQEPYCELGNGACGGHCSAEAKKPWDRAAEPIPCYQSGQRCTCEEADICKPIKKRRRSQAQPSGSADQATAPPATQAPATR